MLRSTEKSPGSIYDQAGQPQPMSLTLLIAMAPPRFSPLRYLGVIRPEKKTSAIGKMQGGKKNRTETADSAAMPYSLRDGMNIQSGFSAQIGKKNTMTRGSSSIFDQLPRLYVDYRDNLSKDLKSEFPMHTRLRSLAFVSLNKKDNWFHVLKTDYTDYINQSNSYREKQVILGTVDQQMKRNWVDFTNWIKISADGQYTKHTEQFESANNYEFYDLNLFAIASRSRWEARTFNNFRRTIDVNGLTYDTRVPLYLSGYYGSDTDWRVRLSAEQSKVKLIQDYDTNDYLFSYRVDTFKRELFTLMHTGSIENYEKSDTGRTITLDAHLETSSTRRFSPRFGLFGSYNITSSKNQPFNSGDTTSLTQMIDLKGVYTPTNSLRMELKETVTIVNGDSSQDLTANSFDSQGSFVGSNTGTFSVPRGSYTRYRTLLRGDWQPMARVRVGLSITDDILRADGANEHGTEFQNTVDYSNRRFSARLRTFYTRSSVETGSSSNIGGDGSVSYSPDRSLDSSIHYSFSEITYNGGNYFNSNMRQSTNYYLYTDYGVSRRILELNQSLEYEDRSYNGGIRNTTKSLIGGVRYYPISRLFIAGRAKYSLLSPQDATQFLYNATVGLNFNLMQASIDYSVGRQNGNGNRLERRLEANVRKTF